MQSLAQAEGGANADEDSHEVVNVFSTDPAPTSDFDEYLNSLHSAAMQSHQLHQPQQQILMHFQTH